MFLAAPLHVCFAALDYPSAKGGSGVGNQVRLLAKELVRLGHRVTVIALGREPSDTTDDGVRVVRVRLGNWHWYLSRIPLLGRVLVLPVREWERSRAVRRAIEEVDCVDPIDVIEGTETGMLGVVMRSRWPAAIRLHGEPYTVLKYTPDQHLTVGHRLARLVQRRALRRANLLISPSRTHSEEIVRELGGKLRPLQVVSNVVSSDLGKNDTVAGGSKPETGDHPDLLGPIVLYVGRLEKGKGVPTLLRAAARILAEFPEAHLVLAGDRHPSFAASDLTELLKPLPPNRVHLLGHVPWERLAHWYHRASVSVLPSFYETFGLAALEPGAFGVPVVASRAGGLQEVVVDGQTGLLVPPGDEQALAVAIGRLLADAVLRKTLGENARRWAAKYAVDQRIEETLELFRWVFRAARPQSGTTHVFISPHLDDAVLSCGGTIHAIRQKGDAVRVITTFATHDFAAPSAFVRHLHRKWFSEDVPFDRRAEDCKALALLGVSEIEHWDYSDAPYRTDATGRPYYCSYQELRDNPRPEDGAIVAELRRRIEDTAASLGSSPTLYFPLGLGEHVDHVLLFRVGLQLRAAGREVRFYEDWPYAEHYRTQESLTPWLPERIPINVPAKHQACRQYRSQLAGLGGTSPGQEAYFVHYARYLLSTRVADPLEQRLTTYACAVGNGVAAERTWWISSSLAGEWSADTTRAVLPLSRFDLGVRFRDLKRVLETVRSRQLDSVLSPGQGLCAYLGSEPNRNSEVIEQLGYRCLMVEPGGNGVVPTGNRFPIEASSAAAVVAWEFQGSIPETELLIKEAYQALEHGGVFCGSVTLGQSRRSQEGGERPEVSPDLLKRLLKERGFVDIIILPGMARFAQSLRSFFLRRVHRRANLLAHALTVACLLPLVIVFLASWVARWLGLGSGRGMLRVTNAIPLTVAGHARFAARKPSQSSPCTSAS